MSRKGTRARRAERIRNSYLGSFIEACEEMERGRESFRRNWSGGFGFKTSRGDLVEYIPVPLGTHRDADPREESNWSVIEPAMEKADSFGHVAEHAGVVFHTEGSALCGWVENIYVRVDDAAALREAMAFVQALEYDPVLDDEDYDQRQWEADHPDSNNCYADGDCDCAVATHDCAEWFKAVCRNPESVEDSFLFEIDGEENTFWCAGPGCNDWVPMTSELWNFYWDNL